MLSQSTERQPSRLALGTADERQFDEGIIYLDENELSDKSVPGVSEKIF